MKFIKPDTASVVPTTPLAEEKTPTLQKSSQVSILMSTKIIILTDRVKREAEQHLAQSDKVMARLIATHGVCKITINRRHPFETLATSIISQQLSVKAADTIEKRVRALMKAFDHNEVLSVPHETLRSAGLSNGKVRYLHALANHIVDGRLDFEAFTKLSDEHVIDALTEVPGIGKWTAEMFLLFGLRRADVLATGDVALQRAVRNLYDEKKTLEQVSKKWRPYASVASWYLWRSLDNK